MKIREITENDFENIWPIFEEIVHAGETYAYPRDIKKDAAKQLWIEYSSKTFVFEDENGILGTYYIKTNQSGPGQHVCNCGYMVSSKARGQGIASKMCEHSQLMAKKLGYKAMQFNFVASTNDIAVQLWDKLGFETVGRLPKAFLHPTKVLWMHL